MSDTRGRLILFSLWISEGVRIFAFAAITLILFGFDSPPLGWFAMASVMGISMITTWVIGGARGDVVTLAIIQVLVGLPVIYLASAARLIGGDPGLDFNWPFALGAGNLNSEAVFGVVVALILSLILWIRGAALLNSPEPETGQRMIFYTGAAGLGILLLTEQITGHDVNAGYLTIPFFASALSGMAINHLATVGDANSGSAFWSRFTPIAVGGILLSAVMLTTLAVVFDDATHALGRWLAVLISWILMIIAVPFALLATAAVWAIQKFRGDGPSGLQFRTDSGLFIDPDDTTPIVQEEGESVFNLAVELLRVPLAVIIVLAVLLVLYLTFRRYLGGRRRQSRAYRESIRADADAGRDMAKLLGRLLPDWMKRTSADEYLRSFPANEPGISEVFQLYFRYLKVATSRGMLIAPGQTPNELRVQLAAALPGMPVDLMTERFNAACYGREPSSPDVVRKLQMGLRD